MKRATAVEFDAAQIRLANPDFLGGDSTATNIIGLMDAYLIGDTVRANARP